MKKRTIHAGNQVLKTKIEQEKNVKKRKKLKEKMRIIPVMASGFIAISALTYLFFQLPTTSEQLVEQKESRLVTIDRAVEEIQTVAHIAAVQPPIMMEKKISNTPLPPVEVLADFELVKEEWVSNGQGHLYHYENEEQEVVIAFIENKDVKNQVVDILPAYKMRLETEGENGIIIVTGNVENEVLTHLLHTLRKQTS